MKEDFFDNEFDDEEYYDLLEDAEDITENDPLDEIAVESIKSLTKKDLVDIKINDNNEARFIIDSYYQIQKMRIAKAGQIRAIMQGYDKNSADTEFAKEHLKALYIVYESLYMQEKNMLKILDKYSYENYLSKWARQNMGIGPVLSAAMQAYFVLKEDENGNCISHCSSWWDYAGLNNNNRPWLGSEKSAKIVNDAINNNGGKLDAKAMAEICLVSKWKIDHFRSFPKAYVKGKWDKEQVIKACSVIPYNKKLKVICWKIGQSFHKIINNEKSLYGRLFAERLAYETMKNNNGDYAGIVKGKDKLEQSHLYRRAERYATKMFISHCYEAAYQNKYGVPAPNPYILDFGEHTDYVGPEVPYDSVTV